MIVGRMFLLPKTLQPTSQGGVGETGADVRAELLDSAGTPM